MILDEILACVPICVLQLIKFLSRFIFIELASFFTTSFPSLIRSSLFVVALVLDSCPFAMEESCLHLLHRFRLSHTFLLAFYRILVEL